MHNAQISRRPGSSFVDGVIHVQVIMVESSSNICPTHVAEFTNVVAKPFGRLAVGGTGCSGCSFNALARLFTRAKSDRKSVISPLMPVKSSPHLYSAASFAAFVIELAVAGTIVFAAWQH
mmetsp:Transcript_18747/g.27112  ORF Transcript_18747/g.27112 Transcript_18747/m.27112 type:complete len:120 (+) Transcript_18747:214-573(+)